MSEIEAAPVTQGDIEALFQAAEQGGGPAIRALIRNGVPVNARDDQGRTALHRAARSALPRISALLLALGARVDIADATGRHAFDLESLSPQKLHRIRQVYQRLQTHDYRRGNDFPEPILRVADQLDRDGIVKVSGLIGPETIDRMHIGVAQFISEVKELLAQGKGIKRHYDEELHWCPSDKAFICNNAFKYSSDLVEFCFNPALLAMVNLYLGKPSFVSRGVIVRYPPAPSSDQRAFNWHHDMEDKRLKIMVLLTDIGPDDQFMSYVAGSHRLFHPLEMFRQNSYPLDYCKAQLGEIRIVNSTGKAGDIFLFDSNGSHRAVRNATGALRDAFFVEFATNQSQVWGGDIDTALVQRLSHGKTNPFHRMQTVEKKWNQPATRKIPGWVDTLQRYDTWIA